MGSNPYKFAFDLVAFQRSLFIYDIYEPQVTKKMVFSLVFAKSRCVMIPKITMLNSRITYCDLTIICFLPD